jgi:hypothetical protein
MVMKLRLLGGRRENLETISKEWIVTMNPAPGDPSRVVLREVGFVGYL